MTTNSGAPPPSAAGATRQRHGRDARAVAELERELHSARGRLRILPSPWSRDAVLKDRVQRLWLAWTQEADADGLTDSIASQARAARAMFEASRRLGTLAN